MVLRSRGEAKHLLVRPGLGRPSRQGAGGGARPPRPGPSAPESRRHLPRAPGLGAPSSPQAGGRRSRGPCATPGPASLRGNGAKAAVGRRLRASRRIANKGILERTERARQAPPRGGGTWSLEPPSLLARHARSWMWGSFRFALFLTYAPQKPTLASAARRGGGPLLVCQPRRRLLAHGRHGACLQAGLEPDAHRGAGSWGATAEPAPCETAAPTPFPLPPLGELLGPSRAGPPRPRAHRPETPAKQAMAVAPRAAPTLAVKKPCCAGLARPPPPLSLPHTRTFFEMFCNELSPGKRKPKNSPLPLCAPTPT